MGKRHDNRILKRPSHLIFHDTFSLFLLTVSRRPVPSQKVPITPRDAHQESEQHIARSHACYVKTIPRFLCVQSSTMVLHRNKLLP
ncbi:unnamed protein product, partial [Linum tenue]